MMQNWQIPWASVAFGLLVVAVLSLLPGAASAHAAHDAPPPVVLDNPEDPAHADAGHPGHCHGGTFCSGLAVMVMPAGLPALTERATRLPVPLNPAFALPVAGLDPPPPRNLS